METTIVYTASLTLHRIVDSDLSPLAPLWFVLPKITYSRLQDDDMWASRFRYGSLGYHTMGLGLTA